MLIERLEPPVAWLDALAQVLAAGAGAAVVEVVDGPATHLGAKVVVGEDGSVLFPAEAGAAGALLPAPGPAARSWCPRRRPRRPGGGAQCHPPL